MMLCVYRRSPPQPGLGLLQAGADLLIQLEPRLLYGASIRRRLDWSIRPVIIAMTVLTFLLAATCVQKDAGQSAGRSSS